MLEKLNQKIQGIFAWVIISIITITFALFGVEYYMQSKQVSPPKVEVNGEPITIQEYNSQYQRHLRLINPADLTRDKEEKLKLQISEEMIMKTIAVQAATANGFAIMLPQVFNMIQNISQFHEEGHFSRDRYKQLLSNAHFTPESFQTDVQQGMLINQQQFSIDKTAFALPYEIQRFVQLFLQTRDYAYIIIPYQKYLQQVKVDESEIAKYYEKHKSSFRTNEQVQLDYVQLSMQDIRDKIHISESELKKYYDENKSSFTTPAQWQVSHIYLSYPKDANMAEQNRIRKKAEELATQLQQSPDKFDSDVKKYSDDKYSVTQNGVLPLIVAGQSDYDQYLINETVPGKITAAIQTPKGYEIFKILAYQPPHTNSFEEVKQVVEDQLRTEKLQTVFSRALEQMSDLAYQTPDTLGPVANALKLKVQHSPYFSREGGGSDLLKNPHLIQATFSKEVLDEGNNSEPVQIDNNTVVVLRVANRKPESEQSLAEVKSEIEAVLRKQQAELEAKKIGEAILAQKNNIAEQNKILGLNQLNWQSVQNDRRSEEKNRDTQSINYFAFQLSGVGMSGKVMNDGNYAIVNLKTIRMGDYKSLTKDQDKAVIHQIEALNGAMTYDLYMRSLLKNAKIIRH